MVKALEVAIEKVRHLPEERQAYAAHVLEQIALDDGTMFRIPEGHRTAVKEGLAQSELGELASDAEVSQLLRKPWA